MREYGEYYQERHNRVYQMYSSVEVFVPTVENLIKTQEFD